MPWVGFEPMIQVFERAKTVHALDRTATVIGQVATTFLKIITVLLLLYFSELSTNFLHYLDEQAPPLAYPGRRNVTRSKY
jgi:hypothetical protein